MKTDFLTYIQETFGFSPKEMADFEAALNQPLAKSIRINTNKISISDFKNIESKDNYSLSETYLGKNMLYIYRTETGLPIGHTLEHINGSFYVQELAASSSPFYMSGDSIDTGDYTILDMSASPGGKTTQLAEYYPNALIIANELDKSRLKQLFENIDRMGAKNTIVSNYDGRFFKNIPESFDKVLLDAPCSGEGTAYKTGEALKYWNIKNIQKIAKLQSSLFESALISLKVGGEIVYSTCTLNRVENEDVVEKILEKYGEMLEIVALPSPKSPSTQELAQTKSYSQEKQEYIRNWPHRNNTGGFFVVKLRKIQSFGETKNTFLSIRQGFEKITSTQEREISHFLAENYGLLLPGRYFSYRSEVYYIEKMSDLFWENTFLYKIGIKIGVLNSGVFEPFFVLGTSFGIFKKQSLHISKDELHSFFKGEERSVQEKDGYYQIVFEGRSAGIIKIKNRVGKTLLDNSFLRK